MKNEYFAGKLRHKLFQLNFEVTITWFIVKRKRCRILFNLWLMKQIYFRLDYHFFFQARISLQSWQFYFAGFYYICTRLMCDKFVYIYSCINLRYFFIIDYMIDLVIVCLWWLTVYAQFEIPLTDVLLLYHYNNKVVLYDMYDISHRICTLFCCALFCGV